MSEHLYLIITNTLSILFLLVILAGLITFRVLYKPFWPLRHGRSGAHLIYMFDALLFLFSLELVFTLIPIPLLLGATLQVVAFCVVAFVVWQRVDLYRDFKRGELDQPDPPAKVE